MADGAITIEPPGTIGLSADDGAVVLLRFDEAEASQRPQDSAGSLNDLVPGVGMTMPGIVDGVTGRARRFTGDLDGTALVGLTASDRVSGTSLLTRDVTIQAIFSWDVTEQKAASTTGTLIRRGDAYALKVAAIDGPSRTGRVGNSTTFVMPPGFALLTMTRRWVSPTLAVWRYYLGDRLLGEESGMPYIGGATVDPIFVGCGTWEGYDPFMGAIDEVVVLDHVISREEIEATWLRLTRYQPLGYQLLKELHDPGFPISSDPGSDVQLDTRMQGHALGYAVALAENLRANLLPTRAYGSVLEDWEQTMHALTAPLEGIDERRARVVALLRQRRGVSIPGMQDALAGVVGIDTSLLEFLAFSNTITDGFAALEAERWDVQPAGSVTAASGAARFAPGAGTYAMNGSVRSWVTMATAVGGDAREAHLLAKLVMTTPIDTVDAGIYFGNWPLGNYLLLGLLDVAGVFKVITESFVANVSQGQVVRATLGANPAALWLHLYQTAVNGTWRAAWSTTSGLAGFTTSAAITHPTLANLGGCYLRSIGAVAAPVANFDDLTLRTPWGDRPYMAYVYRDPALGSTTDIDGAHSVIDAIKHAYTEATIITSKSVLCDDEGSLLDRGPMGAL